MAEQDEITPIPGPDLHIPSSNSTIEVSIINTTTDLVSTTRSYAKPSIPGHEYSNLPTFAFLLHHIPSGKHVLYDLGARKDWWNWSPKNYGYIIKEQPGIKVTKNINEVLADGGFDSNTVDSIIWSHFHFDHTGDASLFPGTTEVVVGEGFNDAFLPGYPTNPEGAMLDSDVEGRNVREIQFNDTFRIGGLRAHDFFGDGSFYLLDTPGHCPAHISALARTTPDTFVFFGGDICHLASMWRPTKHMPMPSTIPQSVPMDKQYPSPCPCSIFTACHPGPTPRTTPYYQVTDKEGSLYMDPAAAQHSVDRMKEFDASENVLICIAHDPGLLPVLNFFPHGTINDWKAKGYKEATAWGFLNEMPANGKAGRPLFVEGIVRDGKTLRGATEVH